jgi:type I restriction enzyme M protein
MMDASSGYMKDGPKNRLREQDIHQIVDVFTKQIDMPKLARMVSLEEIEKNDFNLNLPRYIDSSVAEDLQDIAGHLQGGIPVADIDSPALKPYWDVCPALRQSLFSTLRPGYLSLAVDKTTIKSTIHAHAEFTAFVQRMNTLFADWQTRTTPTLKALQPGFHPKQLIVDLSEDLLAHYTGQPLIDAYAVYQHLMDYWATTMQDDAYLIAADGWKAETYRVIEVKKNKDGKVTKTTDKGWACDLVPKPLIVARYFAQDQAAIDELAASLDSITAQITELEEEHSGDDAAFSGFDKINKAGVTDRLREIKGDADAKEEADVLSRWLKLAKEEADLKKRSEMPRPRWTPRRWPNTPTERSRHPGAGGG